MSSSTSRLPEAGGTNASGAAQDEVSGSCTVEIQAADHEEESSPMLVCCSREPLLSKESTKSEPQTAEERFISKLQLYIKQRETHKLALKWVTRTLPFYAEIIILVGIGYYADVLLDIKAISIFYYREDYRYMTANALAIQAGNVYSLLDMLRKAPGTDPAWVMLAVGYLTPCHLHIALLCYLSLKYGQKHVLLECSKLAEAAIEAFISSLVQAYALIFSDWNLHDRIVMSLSTCSSFLSIGYAFTCFDTVSGGLNGVPGKLNGFSLQVILILFIRVAEVSSRIASIALFGVVTRKSMNIPADHHWIYMVRKAWTYFFLNDVPSLLLADFLVLFCLTLYFQRKNVSNSMYALPSVLCFMNPLLERSNPFSVPALVYYSWRLVEMLFMVAVAFSSHTLQELKAALSNDSYILEFCLLTTAIWVVLVPVVRFLLAVHVVFEYTPDMVHTGPLKKSQLLMIDELRLSGQEFTVQRGQLGHSGSDKDSETITEGAMMRKKTEHLLLAAIHGMDKAIATESQQKGNKARAPSPNDDNRDNNAPVGKEAQGDNVPVSTKTAGHETPLPALYDWASGVIAAYQEEQLREVDVEVWLLRLLHTGANLIPREPIFYCRSGFDDEKRHKELYVKFLECLIKAVVIRRQEALNDLETVCQVLPSWDQWSKTSPDNNDVKLHEAKWRIIDMLGCVGWRSRDFDSSGDAARLFRAMDVKLRGQMPAEMAETQWEVCGLAQMRTLVSLWLDIPSRGTRGEVEIDPDFLMLFRLDVEWEAMREGAQHQLKNPSGKKGIAWDSKDLQKYCASVTKAFAAGLRVHGAAEILEAVQASGINHLEELFNKFAADTDKISSGTADDALSKIKKGPLKTFQDAIKNVRSHNRDNWCRPVMDSCEAKLLQASERLEKVEQAENAKVRAKAEQAAETKAKEREAKREKKRLEEREELRKKLEAEKKDAIAKAHGEMALKSREARKEATATKVENERLERENQALRTQSSGGIIIAVTVTEDIKRFVEYLKKGTEDFQRSMAEILRLPDDAIEGEAGWPDIEGVMLASIHVSDEPPSSPLWEKLGKLKDGEGELMQASEGLSVRVTEVHNGSSFVARFEGTLDSIMDESFEEDMLEDLGAQLDLAAGSLDSLTVVNITGNMKAHCYVSVRDMVTEQVSRQPECSLSGARVNCTLTCVDSADLESEGSASECDNGA